LSLATQARSGVERGLESQSLAGFLTEFARGREAIGLLKFTQGLPGLGPKDTIDRAGRKTGGF
jgi:hypothetical protein